MRRRLFALLAAALFPAFPSGAGPNPTGAPEPAPAARALSAGAFGAAGDGRTDDTEALRRAIEAAVADRDGRPAPRRLALPAGTYRITDTIRLTPEHNNLVLEGTGGIAGRGNTRLVWDGPEGGVLLETWAQAGLQMRDLVLDGGDKAGILLRANSTDRFHPNEHFARFGQRAATAYTLERVRFMNADTGIRLGDESHINTDLMTFSHCQFSRLETGIRMHSIQNLGYHIVRPDFGWVGTGIWITGGGFVDITLFNSHHTDTAIRVEGQGINSGVFRFAGVRPEQGARTPGKRPVLLMASGEVNIVLTGAQTTACAIFGEEGDLETPAFILGPGAQVVVEGGQITGKIARLRGDPGEVPTFLTLRNCRFRCGADPRAGIEADAFSGYTVIDSVVTVDEVRTGPYRVLERVLIPRLSRYPEGTAPAAAAP